MARGGSPDPRSCERPSRPVAAVGGCGKGWRGAGSVGRGERDTVARGTRLYEAARAVVGDHARAVEAVRAALKPIHDEAVKRELDAIPVARLQDVTEGRLRLGNVEESGL